MVRSKTKPKTLSREAVNWLEKWTYALRAPPLTKKIEREFNQFRPSKPVKLYRAHNICATEDKPLKSWTYERGMAETIYESDPCNALCEAFINPEDILVDFTRLPPKISKEEFLNEVIVKTNKERKGVVAYV